LDDQPLNDFVELFNNEVFVDFFNTFLHLPVFGQTPFYSIKEKEWVLHPPLPSALVANIRPFMKWLMSYRYHYFLRSELFIYYILCQELLEFSTSPAAGEELAGFWVTVKMLFQIEKMGAAYTDQYFSLLRILKDSYIQEGAVVLTTCNPDQVNRLLKLSSWDHLYKTRRDILQQMHTEALLKLQTYWLPCFFTHCKLSLEKVEECSMLLQHYQEKMFQSRPSKENVPSRSMSIKQSSAGTQIYSTKQTKRHLWHLPIISRKVKLKNKVKVETEEIPLKDNCWEHYMLPRKPLSSTKSSKGTRDRSLSPKRNKQAKKKTLPPLSVKKVVLATDRNSGYGDLVIINRSRPLIKTPSLLYLQRALEPPQQYQYLHWGFSADSLAGELFTDFLNNKSSYLELNCLRFWKEMNSFLQVVFSFKDGRGHLIRNIMAQRILEIYLNKSSKQYVRLKRKTMKRLQAFLPFGEVVPWIDTAQDEICEVLSSFFDDFLDEEDRVFIALMVSTRHYKLKRSKNELISINSSMLNLKKLDNRSDNFQSLFPDLDCEQWQILAAEYLGEGGSLQKAFEPVIKMTGTEGLSFEELSRKNPKLAVQELSKNYEFYYTANPQVGQGMTYVRKNVHWKMTDLKFIKKGNTVIRRPSARPRSLMEVLHNAHHLEFFKHFLQMSNAEAPLLFWQAIEKLISLEDPKARTRRIAWILSKFFPRNCDPVELLECDATIVREIPKISNVSLNTLVSAQMQVLKALEENRFRTYQETFNTVAEEVSETSLKQRRASMLKKKLVILYFTLQKRRVWGAFSAFIRGVCKFRKTMNMSTSRRAFEEFLRSEIYNDQQNQLANRFNSTMRISGPRQHNLNSYSNEGGDSEAETPIKRRTINNRTIIVNFLANDLNFYLEVSKFNSMADAASLLASSGLYGINQETQLRNKANMIIKLFLQSEIPPKLRVNITENQKDCIVETVNHGYIDRSLFHSAIMNIFPIMIHFWKK
uniref:Regulator of G protein signaling like 1 n=1 Tax=Latimeria chalumnae TaxID=7897 RepID=H2ZWT7_LATCH